MVAGGGLVSSVISTIPPNLPLIREACGKTLDHCKIPVGSKISSLNAALEAAKKEYERLGIPYVEE